MKSRDEATFEGRVIVVAGAASGMGRATAGRLGALGATVYAADIDGEALDAVAHTAGATACAVDISRSADCDRLIDRVFDEQGRLDGLANFAGVIRRTGLLECSDEDFDRVLDVNARGCFYLCRAAARIMKREGHGSIVNVSSIWSDIAAAGVFAYCVSKGAVSQITRAAALDLAGSGVRVNEIRPGETRTPMLAAERGRALSEAELEARLAAIAAEIPERRLAEPEEIADAAIFLLSDASRYMQGASLTIDGGYTIC